MLHLTPTSVLAGTWPGMTPAPAADALLCLVRAENCSRPTWETRPPFLDDLLRIPSSEVTFSLKSLGRPLGGAIMFSRSPCSSLRSPAQITV